MNKTMSTLAAGATIALLLAGCSAATTGQAPSNAAASGAPSARPSGRANPPGASGIIAEIDGMTLQVQSTAKQTSVSYTDQTTFTSQIAGAVGDITVGSCVRVLAPDGAAASSVAVSAAVNGQCAMPGRQGGQGGQGGGARTNRPSAAPTSSSSPMAHMTFGQVTAASATSITVLAATQNGATPSPVTIQLGSSTTVSKAQSATAKDLKVGECVVARGQADATGAVSATNIAISQAVNGQCGTGR